MITWRVLNDIVDRFERMMFPVVCLIIYPILWIIMQSVEEHQEHCCECVDR